MAASSERTRLFLLQSCRQLGADDLGLHPSRQCLLRLCRSRYSRVSSARGGQARCSRICGGSCRTKSDWEELRDSGRRGACGGWRCGGEGSAGVRERGCAERGRVERWVGWRGERRRLARLRRHHERRACARCGLSCVLLLLLVDIRRSCRIRPGVAGRLLCERCAIWLLMG